MFKRILFNVMDLMLNNRIEYKKNCYDWFCVENVKWNCFRRKVFVYVM